MTKKKTNNKEELTPKIKEQVRELAKKNFIKQKIKEIEITIGSILGIIFIPYLIGLTLTSCVNCSVVDIWAKVWATGFLIVLALLTFGGICYMFWYMIWDIIKGIIDSNCLKSNSNVDNEEVRKAFKSIRYSKK